MFHLYLMIFFLKLEAASQTNMKSFGEKQFIFIFISFLDKTLFKVVCFLSL